MYRLHYFPNTASLAPRMVLEELALPHSLVLIDRDGGALDSPAYRALQPLGKIPALETPDGPMFETAAILLYLADRHGALAPDPQNPARAAFLKWFFFTAFNLHPTLLSLFYPERVAGPACLPDVLATARHQMQDHLTLLDRMVAAETPDWFSGKPSIFGYYLGMLLHWLGEAPGAPSHFPCQDYPALFRILALLEQRPAVQRVALHESLGALPFTQPN